MGYKPKVVRGTVKNTNTPLDGVTLHLALWAWDDYSSYHLYGYDTADKEKIILAMKQADDLYQEESIEEFTRLWESGEYEPDMVYCIDLDKVDVIEVVQEEEI